jgi:hypothetical protein
MSLRTSFDVLIATNPTLKSEEGFARNFEASILAIRTFIQATSTFDKIKGEYDGAADGQLLCLSWFSRFIGDYKYDTIVDEIERTEEERKLDSALYRLSVSSLNVGFDYLAKRSISNALNIFANVSISHISGHPSPISKEVINNLRIIAEETSQLPQRPT